MSQFVFWHPNEPNRLDLKRLTSGHPELIPFQYLCSLFSKAGWWFPTGFLFGYFLLTLYYNCFSPSLPNLLTLALTVSVFLSHYSWIGGIGHDNGFPFYHLFLFCTYTSWRRRSRLKSTLNDT